jgi:hypothetical protein
MKAAASQWKARRDHGWRLATWALIVAFAIQSYITQTHIHAPARNAVSGIAKVLVKNPARGKTQDHDDGAECLFCQAVVHSGAFFAPASPVLPLPAQSALVSASLVVAIVQGMRRAWIWQSRAPPHH